MGALWLQGCGKEAVGTAEEGGRDSRVLSEQGLPSSPQTLLVMRSEAAL